MTSELRTAVVTGGSSGIGKAICESFLSAGMRVISLSRKPGPIAHANFIHIEADLSDVAATRRAAASISQYPVTTIVHNAGASSGAMLEDVDIEDFNRLAHLHLAVPILLTQSCLPAMRSAAFGRIIIISSRAIIGLASRSVYAATKSGLTGMARTWALELGPSGITVNIIAPGPVQTGLTPGLAQGSERERALSAAMPVRRLGRPEDIARAAMYFADADNGYVTGQTLFVCGGASLGGLKTIDTPAK